MDVCSCSRYVAKYPTESRETVKIVNIDLKKSRKGETPTARKENHTGRQPEGKTNKNRNETAKYR